MALTAHLVVLNYNGESLLRSFLPGIVEESAKSRYSCRVTVLDNVSRDGSVAYVEANFPSVQIYRARENKVLCSFNDFAENTSEDVLVFLNNDMRLHSGFVDPLIAAFEAKKDIFFSTSHGNRSIALFRHGILEAANEYPGFLELNEKEGQTFAAGVLAVWREKFLELGGYDELYLPGRYEDVDLCYRAWVKGWAGYYAPQANQDHLGGASFDAVFGFRKTQRMVFRNSLLFMVKNIQDMEMLSYCFLITALRLPIFILTGKFFLLGGFVDFLKRLPQAIRARKEAKKQRALSDKVVIKKINSFYSTANMGN